MTARACDKTPLARQGGGQRPALAGRPPRPEASAPRSARSRPVKRPALPDGRPGRGGDPGRYRSPAQANHAKRARHLRIFLAAAAFPSCRRAAMRAGKECAASSGFCRPRHKAPGKGDSLLIQGECWANQATLLDILRFTAQNLCNESGLPLWNGKARFASALRCLSSVLRNTQGKLRSNQGVLADA